MVCQNRQGIQHEGFAVWLKARNLRWFAHELKMFRVSQNDVWVVAFTQRSSPPLRCGPIPPNKNNKQTWFASKHVGSACHATDVHQSGSAIRLSAPSSYSVVEHRKQQLTIEGSLSGRCERSISPLVNFYLVQLIYVFIHIYILIRMYILCIYPLQVGPQSQPQFFLGIGLTSSTLCGPCPESKYPRKYFSRARVQRQDLAG